MVILMSISARTPQVTVDGQITTIPASQKPLTACQSQEKNKSNKRTSQKMQVHCAGQCPVEPTKVC